MSFNLIESVKGVLSGDMINKMAELLGEDAMHVQLAMGGIVPSILTGVLLKTESSDGQETLNLALEAAKFEVPFNQNSFGWWWHKNSKGIDFLNSLLGDTTTRLTDSIASYGGISSHSTFSLMCITAPTALSVLGRHIQENKMNVTGLRFFLNGQRKIILNAMPASLFLEGIMGKENLSGIAEKFSGTKIPIKKSRSVPIWIWLPLICVAGACAAWYIFHMDKPSISSSLPVKDTVQSTKDTAVSVPAPESPFTLKLPDGTVLNSKKGGTEEQLILFFNDPNSKPSRRYPFNFDQVEFNNGSAVISNESMTQIKNIALILKAYPKAKIKIGGFNAKGGDSVANRQLSESRAVSIGLALKTAGVGKSQMVSAEGFGSEFAKYPQEAPDSLKAKDNRIAISIRGK